MKNLFATLAILSFVLCPSLSAQARFLEANKKESSIKYNLTHPMHEIESESKNLYCKIEYDDAKNEIKRVFAQVDVASFSSGNSNRDSHAMEVVEAITYPYEKFSSSSIERNGDKLKITGKMYFHGVTNEAVIYAQYYIADGKLFVKGNFDLSLTAYKVERPSLLMVPVNDILKFTFAETFNLK